MYFIHIANVVYLLSYAVKDIRWLRCLTIVGIALCIPYYVAFLRYEAVVWSCLFLVINITRLVLLVRKPCEKLPFTERQGTSS